LASISAGEGDWEIGKVNCLHSATTGYAPLIFNLNQKCNAKVFLEKCGEVWKELASNPSLPTKLVIKYFRKYNFSFSVLVVIFLSIKTYRWCNG
jgi:hypothetical protein